MFHNVTQNNFRYEQIRTIRIIIIISDFGIYGAAVVLDSGVGNTWQRLTLVLHEFLSLTDKQPYRKTVLVQLIFENVSHVFGHKIFRSRQFPMVK